MTLLGTNDPAIVAARAALAAVQECERELWLLRAGADRSVVLAAKLVGDDAETARMLGIFGPLGVHAARMRAKNRAKAVRR